MPRASKNSEIHAARDGTAWLQGWECSNWTLSERSLCAGNLQRDAASVPGSGCKKLSAAGPVQLLCRARRDYAGVRVVKIGQAKKRERSVGVSHPIVRILILTPIIIGITLLLMYVPAELLTLRELLLCELFLLLIPMAAYPMREIFRIGKDRRKGQRSTATELLQNQVMFAAAPLSLSVFDCFDSAPCPHR